MREFLRKSQEGQEDEHGEMLRHSFQVFGRIVFMIVIRLPRPKIRLIQNDQPLERMGRLSTLSWIHICLVILSFRFRAGHPISSSFCLMIRDRDLSNPANPVLKRPELDRDSTPTRSVSTAMHANPSVPAHLGLSIRSGSLSEKRITFQSRGKKRSISVRNGRKSVKSG